MNKSIILSVSLAACMATGSYAAENNFNYKVDRFADIEVLRYRVNDFEQLSLQQKQLVYYLTEAAAYGRDILTDQNGKYNLAIRTTLEEIYKNYKGDSSTADFTGFMTYLKQVWFANGIHHHYSTDKFTPRSRQRSLPTKWQNSRNRQLPPSALPMQNNSSKRFRP